jgi:hypothetical protein
MRMTELEKTIPVARLYELMTFDAETGLLTWRPKASGPGAAHWNTVHAGKPALRSKTATGYFAGRIDGRFFFAHRVVFAMTHGHWPVQFIDHENGVRDDNRPGNLRDVSQQQNQQNRQLASTNKSGVIGVHWSGPHGKWRASIKVKRKAQHLGLFSTVAEAAAARHTAEVKLGFHANHGRK